MRHPAALMFLGFLCACTSLDYDTVSSTKLSAYSAPSLTSVRAPRFADNDPVEWKGRTPWHYEIHGTDVSKYQASVNWHHARKSGVSFAFIKATEGGDRLDDKFHDHWHGAKQAGIPRAAYHFFYFCRPAAEQAAWFIRNVPRDAVALPPVLDMEWNPHSPTCKLRPNAETVQKEMRTFLSIVETHYGKKPIIYTSIDFFEDNRLASFHGYPYWLRSVADHPTERYGSHPFTFWQYTGTGVIPGIDGNADVNVFNGSAAAWQKWLKDNKAG